MDFTESLLAWYQENKRDLPWRKTRDPYAVWISEIMLQQTRVAAVIPYYERFLAELPDAAALSAVSDQRLHKLWEGLGYYSRAANLKRAAAEMLRRFHGKPPASFEELLTLPGIGEYTAGAIASIAYGQPVPAVDGNVLRVLARLTDDHGDVLDPLVRKRIRSQVIARLPHDNPGDFNAALMELGAVICVPGGPPRCGVCPVRLHCLGEQRGIAASLPVKKQKKPRKVEEKTVFALWLRDGYLLLQRPEKGLLAGLWQLPDAREFLSEEDALSWLGEHNLHPLGPFLRYDRKHIFTHVEWRMRVYCLSVEGIPPTHWTTLTEETALPTAYRVCLPDCPP